MRLSRVYLWTVAGTVAGAVVVIGNEMLGMVYSRGLGEIAFAVLALTLGYALVGLVCASVRERGKAPALMHSGMTIGLLALVCWIAMVLVPYLQDEFAPIKLFTWPTAWAGLMMLVGVVLLLPMHAGWRWWLRASTIALLAVLAAYIACAISFYPDVETVYGPVSTSDTYWERRWRYEQRAFQIGGAIALLAGGALATTLIAGIVHALSGRAAQTAAIPTPYWLRCPRCGLEQQALTGDHFCAQCRLRTRVEFT